MDFQLLRRLKISTINIHGINVPVMFNASENSLERYNWAHN